jgi:hypothetical protein
MDEDCKIGLLSETQPIIQIQGGIIMIQSWETILGIVVVLAILLPIILKKLY